MEVNHQVLLEDVDYGTPEVDGDDKQYVDNVVKTTSSDSDDSLDYFQKLDKRVLGFLLFLYLRDVTHCCTPFFIINSSRRE